MAIFSKGGTSYPDILVVCYLSTCFLISTILNPAVFLYNYRKKKNSVPVFLFKRLAALDFLICVIIPVKVIQETLRSDCFIPELPMNKNKTCITRVWPNCPNIALRLYTLASWVLTLTPNFLAALMAICRYIQIRFPFFPLKVKKLTIFALMFGTYILSLSGYVAFNDESAYSVDLQVFKHGFGLYRLDLIILIYTWPCILCQICSVVTSLLTIQHLASLRKTPTSLVARTAAISTRSSMKILITNFGSVVNNALTMVCVTIAPTSYEGNEDAATMMFITTVLAPVLLSCFNPVVFIMFTPKFSLTPKTKPSSLSSK